MRAVLRPRRTLAIAIALVLTLLPTSVALGGPHTANCSEYGFVNRQNGYATDRWSNHRTAVRAFFDGQALNLCTNRRPGEGSASTAWVAIQGPPSPYDIVQMGMGTCVLGTGCTAGTMEDAYAWGRTNTSPGCSGYANRMPSGSFVGIWSTGGTYTVLQDAIGDYDLSSAAFSFTISTNLVCWTNNMITVFGETLDYGDSLGGSTLNKFNFTQKQFKTVAGGAWLTLPTLCNASQKIVNGVPSALEGIFKCSASGSALQLWTDR